MEGTPRSKAETCLYCRFCNEVTAAGPIVGQPHPSECRRFPPAAFPVQAGGGMGAAAFYPPVATNNWCGEFQPKGDPDGEAKE